MPLIPKKTAFRLSFRNKTKNKKILKYDLKQSVPIIKSKLGCNSDKSKYSCSIFNRKSAWAPVYPNTLNFEFLRDFALFAKQKSFNHDYTQFKKRNWMNKFIMEIENNSYYLSKKSLIGFKQQHNVISVSHPYTVNLLFGQYGLCFEQSGTLSSKYVETIRFNVSKLMKKGRIWL